VTKDTSTTSTLTLSGANTYTGATTLNAGTLTLSGSLNVGAGTATTVVASGATLNGAGVITAGTLSDSGAGTVSLTGNNLVGMLSTSGTVGAITFSNAQSLALNSITAGTINIQTTGATADLTMSAGQMLTATSTGTPLTLVAGRNFINNSGAAALATPSGRWLVYSTNPANDTVGGLNNSFRRFSCTYGGACPSFPGTGNGLLYKTTPLLTITPSGISSIVYGAAAPSLTGYAYGTTGYLAADAAADSLSGSLTGSTTYAVGSNVGAYAINYSSGTLTSALGYGFTYTNNASAFTVTARAISVAADAKTKVYGANDPALTYQITSGSLYGSDAFTGALNRAAGSNVGAYAINQNTLSAGSNYTISYTGNNLSITPYTLTVNADAKNKTYGSSDPSLTYTYGTLQNGDTSSVFNGALSRVVGENVGSYTVSQNTLSAGSNYTISYTGNNFGITPYTLNVNADAKNKTYGSSDPSLTYTYGTLQNGDTSVVFSGALSRTAGETVGNYTILKNTLLAGNNYTVSYTASNLTINPAVAIAKPISTTPIIPVTVTRVSQDPTLNLVGGSSNSLMSVPQNYSQSAPIQINAQNNTDTLDAVPQQVIVLNDDVQGAWLKISPELAAMLGLSQFSQY
jgi:autotransporter-associated beta strand protein